ncbi:MAG: hypothetical protein DRP20_02625 [Thermotogae bacterium]|nr:MAG: hypothetical protein DRP20_02625 [Thermotogota bacterium]
MNKKELQLVLEEGEGYKIEFKESLAGIDKEMVAFANSSGGKIFLGIRDDREHVVGVSVGENVGVKGKRLIEQMKP